MHEWFWKVFARDLVCVAQVVAQTAGHPSRELYATLLTAQLPILQRV